jgi:hypothetical protein
MIIGHILDVAVDNTNFSGNGGSATATVFYTWADAIAWARAMSEPITSPVQSDLYPMTVIYNTDTNVKRWWYNGTEYTG